MFKKNVVFDHKNGKKQRETAPAKRHSSCHLTDSNNIAVVIKRWMKKALRSTENLTSSDIIIRP